MAWKRKPKRKFPLKKQIEDVNEARLIGWDGVIAKGGDRIKFIKGDNVFEYWPATEEFCGCGEFGEGFFKLIKIMKSF